MPNKRRHGEGGPKDWSPLFPHTPKGLSLAHYLESVVVIGGHGQIDFGDKSPVYIAVVHDGSGYNPAAMIAVDQGSYHSLEQDVIEIAFDLMEQHQMKNEEYVKELQKDWGDRWEEILTESFDGKTWLISDPREAFRAIGGDARSRKYIDIDKSE